MRLPRLVKAFPALLYAFLHGSVWADTTQTTTGACSPTIAGVVGNPKVEINCPGLPPAKVQEILNAVKGLPTAKQVERINQLLQQATAERPAGLAARLLTPAEEEQSYARAVSLYRGDLNSDALKIVEDLIRNVTIERGERAAPPQLQRLARYYVLGATIASNEATNGEPLAEAEKDARERAYARKAYSLAPENLSVLKKLTFVGPANKPVTEEDEWKKYLIALITAAEQQLKRDPQNGQFQDDLLYATYFTAQHMDRNSRKYTDFGLEVYEVALNALNTSGAAKTPEGAELLLRMLEFYSRTMFETQLASEDGTLFVGGMARWLHRTVTPVSTYLNTVLANEPSSNFTGELAQFIREIRVYIGAWEGHYEDALNSFLAEPMIKFRILVKDPNARLDQLRTTGASNSRVFQIIYQQVGANIKKPEEAKQWLDFWEKQAGTITTVDKLALSRRTNELRACVKSQIRKETCPVLISASYFQDFGTPPNIHYLFLSRPLSARLEATEKAWKSLVP